MLITKETITVSWNKAFKGRGEKHRNNSKLSIVQSSTYQEIKYILIHAKRKYTTDHFLIMGDYITVSSYI